MRSQFVILVAACALIVGCGSEPEPAAPEAEPEAAAAPAPALPDMIVAERGGFIPEGVEYDTTNGRLLTGSLSEGSIFQIHEDGRVTAIVTDPDLVSSVGIEVDEPHDRILVSNSDRAVFGGDAAGQAKLGAYDLTTGDRIAMVDLAAAIADAPDDAAYFVNDVTVAEDGTAYATDTRMNVIYRITPDYEASVFYTFEPREGLGLNGIVHHPSGYLLVASGGTLFKVTLADPSATEVTLPEPVGGQDGLLWTADGRLAIVSNSDSRVVALTSSDEWATAQLAGVATYEVQATTGAAVGDDVFVVHPHFNDEDPPSFERVTFQ
jgi:sugar lactone lactonase YvrE